MNYCKFVWLTLLALGYYTSRAGTIKDPGDCGDAILLSQVINYCSADNQYSTTLNTPIAWFKFTATKSEVTIVATGQTLGTPTIDLFIDCGGTGLVGNSSISNNQTTFYKGGLTLGHTYYIAISSGNAQPGSFKLCINNYTPIVQPGQDCATASFLCSTASFSQFNVSGPGNNDNEAAGTCLDVTGGQSEQNSAWYKWQAANNGTLVFTITPNQTTDDIDWVLYDMGTSDNCTQVNAATALRCAAGHGICAIGPNYYKTGLDFAATDMTEESGCGLGQDGVVKYITMTQGHYYALLINNFTSHDNGFTVEFKDQHGVAGTGLFVGSKAVIDYAATDTCAGKQQFVFSSKSTNYKSLKWDFGADASVSGATGEGPYTLTYSTPGDKTVTLEAMADKGCVDVDYKVITVKPFPPKVTITVNKPLFCLNDTIQLKIKAYPGYTYQWTGPDNFTSTDTVITIPATTSQKAGVYTVTELQLPCIADIASIEIPPILDIPRASFFSVPPLNARLATPLDIRFFNTSVYADSFLWDFGDGGTSILLNPVHHYTQYGTYKVKLTAFNHKACSTSVIIGDYVLLDGGSIFTPNAFTPNGDGINDRFTPQLVNIMSYRIMIYNRWGKLLYDTLGYAPDWDGNYMGQPVPAGVYYYVIKGITYFNDPVTKTGYVTVIR